VCNFLDTTAVRVPKMHDDEVDTDASLVHRLVAAQFPEWADLPIQPVLDGGTDNALYRLGADLVVRLPRHERTVGTLEIERRWLLKLAPSLPLAVPAPVAEGVPADGYPWTWSIYEWLEGESAASERVADLRAAAIELAEFVSALQRIDTTDGPPPSRLNAFRGLPLARWDERTRASIAALGPTIDAAAATAAWEAALRAPEWGRSPVWIHGDLDARNLLAKDGRITAVIDWGCLGVGDPACDVAVAWKMLDEEARGVFRTALSIDDATWARSHGWVLSQALNALSYYTLETNAVLVREAERWLAEAAAPPPPASS
jgi:aminoglycoside phosphotransferase (APT) family kinase protein